MLHTDDPASGKAPLRVGLLLDSIRQPRWVADVIATVRASLCSTIALVVVVEGGNADSLAGPQAHRSRLARLLAQRKHWVYDAYSWLDATLFPVRADMSERTSIEALLAGCPILHVVARATEGGDALPDAEVHAVRGYDLDVALPFGLRGANGWAARVAKYGAWDYCFGGAETGGVGAGSESPAGFREVLDGNPATAAMLRMRTAGDPEARVIAQSFIRTRKRSVGQNRLQCHRKSTALVARRLRELYEFGPEALANGGYAESSSGGPEGGRSPGTPTNVEMIAALTRLGGHYVRSKLERAGTFDQWFLAYRFRDDVPHAADAPQQSFAEFARIMPPADRFWADPFPTYHEGRYYVFVEEYPFARRRGHIAVLELRRDGTWTAPVTVLERPYHLSYPFVFRWRGEYFMCPETGGNGTVELYRATAFPYEWELHSTLLDGVRSADPTLAEIGGRWWMFISIAQAGATDPSYLDDELHLFHAPSPLGPWTPHRRNPVKSDVRSTRPAGRLFWRDGALYRPAQDCSVRYGYALAINRVERISPTEYREVVLATTPPRWGAHLVGSHTLNAACGLTVIDGRVRRRRFPWGTI